MKVESATCFTSNAAFYSRFNHSESTSIFRGWDFKATGGNIVGIIVAVTRMASNLSCKILIRISYCYKVLKTEGFHCSYEAPHIKRTPATPTNFGALPKRQSYMEEKEILGESIKFCGTIYKPLILG
jgi:hypothetical protein